MISLIQVGLLSLTRIAHYLQPWDVPAFAATSKRAKKAARDGYLALSKKQQEDYYYFLEHKSEYSEKPILLVFQELCQDGCYFLLRWLHNQYVFTKEDARTNDNLALCLACRYGHLDVARWLHQTFALTPDDVRAKDNASLRGACGKGHLEVARWLHQTFQLTPDDAPMTSMPCGWHAKMVTKM